MFFAIMMFGEPGAEIMYPDPGFPIYRSVIDYTGAKPVPIPLLEKNSFAFSADEVLSRITPKTRLIIVNSPANPTGGVTPAEEMDKLVRALDALWSHPDLCIRRALVLPIRHALLSSGSMETVTEVLSHPQALAQCSVWLATHLPQALQLPTTSTAEAARMVKGSRFRAAIADRSVGELQGLAELAFPVNDVVGNRTRFLLLQRGERLRDGQLASLAFSLHRNAPGALIEALQAISGLGLNMSRIESRPSKRELGEYVFFVDVELPASGADVVLTNLQTLLSPLCEHLADFGAYPSSAFN